MNHDLTLEQLESLAIFERCGMSNFVNIEYIAYLWHLLQKLDRDFARELQRDYKIYKGGIRLPLNSIK